MGSNEACVVRICITWDKIMFVGWPNSRYRPHISCILFYPLWRSYFYIHCSFWTLVIKITELSQFSLLEVFLCSLFSTTIHWKRSQSLAKVALYSHNKVFHFLFLTLFFVWTERLQTIHGLTESAVFKEQGLLTGGAHVSVIHIVHLVGPTLVSQWNN